MFEQFTQDARRVVTGAVEQAVDDRAEVDTAYLLLALCADPGVAGNALRGHGLGADQVQEELRSGAGRSLDAEGLSSLGIDLDDVRRSVEDSFGPGALESVSLARTRRHRRGGLHFGGAVPFGEDAKAVLGQALREALRLDSHSIGAEHLLLGLLGTQNRAVRILRHREVDPEVLRRAVLEALRRSA